MTQVTSRIGIVPTFGTYAYHPYLLARLMATLDQVSAGRIGWNAVTGSSNLGGMNLGWSDGLPEHDTRYDMADEYMEVVRRLWDSWEPGAIIADEQVCWSTRQRSTASTSRASTTARAVR
jgi:alkanesulfonate monooxygenase SsuD/methylene tetrahydromethanopterin reductase-like flavin-dependent oxidoreductase (luciferase family)